jgi:transposase InsO family protein
MAYTINPKLPRVRMEAVRLVKYRGWSTRQVARHTGYNQSTIVRWCQKPMATGWTPIPTLSACPKNSPRALKREVVEEIIKERVGRRRCAEHIHIALKKRKVVVSLSSVKRTLDRLGMLKKRSPWKRPHDHTPRPEVTHTGALLQCDTIHIIAPDGSRIYVYTLIDLFSRWAYVEVVERIGAEASLRFIKKAKDKAGFKFEMIHTDNGGEFSTWFTHGCLKLSMKHRHGRVRKSNDQSFVERFNRTIQEECLDRTTHTINHFKKALREYLPYYNNERTHMGINYQTPLEVMRRS